MDMAKRSLDMMFSAREQMYIPVYQRTYTWKKEHVAVLLSDILTVLEDRSEYVDETGSFIEGFDSDNMYHHYLGTIYTQSKGNKTWEIIDGQQRLTTLTLIIQVVLDKIKETIQEDNHEDKSKYQIEYGKYIYSRDYKVNRLKLGDIDQKELDNIRNGDLTGTGEITTNYKIISRWVDTNFLKGDKGYTLWDIFGAFKQIEIIEVELRKEDDAQEIFDGLNAKGKGLMLSEQIKNYVLMGEDKEIQERIYRNKWMPMETYFKTPTDMGNHIESCTLIINNAQLHGGIGLNGYYRILHYLRKNDVSKRDFIDVLYEHFVVYKNILEGNYVYEIQLILNRLSYFYKGDTDLRAYLMTLLKYYEEGNLTDKQVVQTLLVLENYVYRLFLAYGKAGYTKLNSVHRFIVEYIEHMENNNKNYYADGLKRTLKANTKNNRGEESKGVMPTDYELRINVTQRNFYSSAAENNKTKVILERIENAHNKEQKDVYNKNVSIDHIMPQKLNDVWKRSLGTKEVLEYKNYLHKLGNLTLTGYNGKYSNKGFQEVLHMEDGYKNSIYKNLNKDIVNKRDWDKNAIDKRTDSLLEQFILLYPYD